MAASRSFLAFAKRLTNGMRRLVNVVLLSVARKFLVADKAGTLPTCVAPPYDWKFRSHLKAETLVALYQFFTGLEGFGAAGSGKRLDLHLLLYRKLPLKVIHRHIRTTNWTARRIGRFQISQY